MFGSTRLGDAVWSLHLAFVEANDADDVIYGASDDDVLEYVMHHEEELALVCILEGSTPGLPARLLEQTRLVAQQIWAAAPEQWVDAQIEAWLQWDPASGVDPPYTT